MTNLLDLSKSMDEIISEVKKEIYNILILGVGGYENLGSGIERVNNISFNSFGELEGIKERTINISKMKVGDL